MTFALANQIILDNMMKIKKNRDARKIFIERENADWKWLLEIPSMGEKSAIKLFEAGIRTMRDLLKADEEFLRDNTTPIVFKAMKPWIEEMKIKK